MLDNNSRYVFGILIVHCDDMQGAYFKWNAAWSGYRNKIFGKHKNNMSKKFLRVLTLKKMKLS